MNKVATVWRYHKTNSGKKIISLPKTTSKRKKVQRIDWKVVNRTEWKSKNPEKDKTIYSKPPVKREKRFQFEWKTNRREEEKKKPFCVLIFVEFCACFGSNAKCGRRRICCCVFLQLLCVFVYHFFSCSFVLFSFCCCWCPFETSMGCN